MAYGVADANGYTALFEFDSSGVYDEAATATITTADSLSTIHSKIDNNDIIDVAGGDFTNKGVWSFSSSGSSSSNRKIIRAQGSSVLNPFFGSTAKIAGAEIEGDNLLIHRLDFDREYGGGNNNVVQISGSSNVCLDNVRVHGATGNGRNVKVDSDFSNVHLQNGIIDDTLIVVGQEADALTIESGTGFYLVNQDIFNTAKGMECKTGLGTVVVENNDFHVDYSQRSDGSGNYDINGTHMAAKTTGISNKCPGGSGTLHIQFKNRIWGGRRTDKNLCGITTGQGGPFTLSYQNASNPTTYMKILQNIVCDMQDGIIVKDGCSLNSVDLNLFFNIIRYYAPEQADAFKIIAAGSNQYYLNKVIMSDTWGRIATSGTNSDVRGNMFILCNGPYSAGAGQNDATTSSVGSGTQIDNNAFVESTAFTANGIDNNSEISFTTRANSTQYTASDTALIIPDPPTGTDGACSDHSTYTFTSATGGLTGARILQVTDAGNGGHAVKDFYTIVAVNSDTSVELSRDPTDGTDESGINFTALTGCAYRVMDSGSRTTASSPVTLTTQLGSYTLDGSAMLRCVMAPYDFYRALQSGPIVSGNLRGEKYSIPYALQYIQNHPANNFVSVGVSPGIGSRTGIGADNIQPPTSPYNIDVKGDTITGTTAGGIESVSVDQISNPSVISTSNQTIRLGGTVPAGATANIYYGTSTGVTLISAILAGTYVQGVTLPYDLTGLTNEQPYFIVMTAQDGISESTKTTPELSATPDDPEGEEGSPPQGTVTITDIDASAGTSADVTYSYSGSDADTFSYELNNGGFTNIGTDNPFTISGLTTGTAYNNPGVEMKAVNADGESAVSSPSTFTTASVDLVPNVEGQDLADAVSALEAVGCTTATSLQDSRTFTKNKVISQSPAGDSVLTLPQEVTLTVSTGEYDAVVRVRGRVVVE